MAEKKIESKQAPAQIALASRMLSAGLRVKLAQSPLDEPWKQQSSKRKGEGKRRK